MWPATKNKMLLHDVWVGGGSESPATPRRVANKTNTQSNIVIDNSHLAG